METQRSIILFEQATKSEATKRVYLFYLKKFLAFYHIKDYDSLAGIENERLQVMLEDYLFDLKKKNSARTIHTIFYALELFFSQNDKILNFKKIRRMFPEAGKPTGSHAYTTKDVQNIITNCKSIKQKAFVLLLSSSGIRVGALSDLRVKHMRDMPYGCQALTVYPESKDEYTTFLTPEAVDTLSEYLDERRKNGERINQDSPLFRSNYNNSDFGRVKPMTNEACTALMYRLAKRGNTNRTKQTKIRYSIQAAHGLRKRFNTILKSNNDVNLSIAERLMGHSQTVRLDNSYFDPSVERLFDEYTKVIVELSVSEEIRLTIQNKLKDKKIKKLESDKDKRIADLELKFDSLVDLIKKAKDE